MGTLGVSPPQGLKGGGGGGLSSVTIQDDGAGQGTATTFNFGTGVTASVAGGVATINVTGAGGTQTTMNIGRTTSKAGASAGWLTSAADNTALTILAAGATTATLVIPIYGLEIGDTVTAFSLAGRVDSAGNNVTIDCALRKSTVTDASTITDSLVKSMTQLVVNADTALSSSNTGTTLDTPEVMAANEQLYLLVTGTTGASTFINLHGANVDVTKVSGGASITFVQGGTFYKADGIIDAVNLISWRAPFSCTVTNVRGYRVGGTGATINARRNGADNHLSSALSVTNADTWMDGGAVQNTAYVAGDKMEIMLVSATALPTQIAIQVDFTRP